MQNENRGYDGAAGTPCHPGGVVKAPRRTGLHCLPRPSPFSAGQRGVRARCAGLRTLDLLGRKAHLTLPHFTPPSLREGRPLEMAVCRRSRVSPEPFCGLRLPGGLHCCLSFSQEEETQVMRVFIREQVGLPRLQRKLSCALQKWVLFTATPALIP